MTLLPLPRDSILNHESHLCHVYIDTKEQCLGGPAGSLLGGSFRVPGSWEVRQEKAYLCVGGASSGGWGLAPPQAHVGSINTLTAWGLHSSLGVCGGGRQICEAGRTARRCRVA